MMVLGIVVLMVATGTGWACYWSVKRENRDLRRSLLADDASALWQYVADEVFSLRRDDPGQWLCNGGARSATPQGAVRKHCAMKIAAERVEAELREDT